MIERRKKEISIDLNTRILQAEILKPLDRQYSERLNRMILGDRQGIDDQAELEKAIFENIQDLSEENFSFIQFSLPKQEICCSSCFTYETSTEIYLKTARGLPFTLNSIFFHVIPLELTTKVIVGCLKASTKQCWTYIEEFLSVSEAQQLKKISDILICLVENWACSPKFYRSHIISRQRRINQLIRERMYNPNERAELNFNLFEV